MRKAILCIIVSIILSTSSTFLVMYHLGFYLPWQSECGVQRGDEYLNILYNNTPTEIQLYLPGSVCKSDLRCFSTMTLSVKNRTMLNVLKGEPILVHRTYRLDKAKLRHTLESIYVEGTPASISINKEGKLVLKESENLADFNIGASIAYIHENMSQFSNILDLRDFANEVKPSNADMQKTLDKLEWINDFHIDYTKDFSINAKDLSPYVSKKGTFDAEKVSLDSILDILDNLYSTKETSITFKDHSKKERTVSYKTFGAKLNRDAERAFIMSCIRDKKSVTDRIPSMFGFSDFSKGYIEVDKSEQKVYHIVNGKIHCKSDCVTGTKNKHDTPVGVYYISEKIPGKYLVGDNYKTWVNVWMRLTNTGIGLHDAYWRSSFGGTLYITHGSHGCVNLPPNFVSKLYKEVTVGYPVIIY